MSGIPAGSLAGGKSAVGRVENDFYATPPICTRALLDREPLNGSILEPACGAGHISEILKEYYPDSKIDSSDLIDRGYGEVGVDFLSAEYGRKYVNVVTNPPFRYMQEFAEKALEIAGEKVIMFGRIQFLEGQRRRAFFEKHPPKYVYVFSERQAPWRNGEPLDANGKKLASTLCFAWFVWEIGFSGDTTVRWI